MLALGLVLAGCDNGSTSSVGEYNLIWGAYNNYVTMTDIENTIANQNWPVTSANDGKYAIGDTARSIRTYCVGSQYFTDGGAADGSYEDLLNYTSNGIGLPSDLKNAMASQKASVPIAGVFKNPLNLEVMFYVSKN
ncbi:hypothetical protein TREAZ_2985 [Leadbettera azotonutricia ZAS-9]|uniref:Uncharacterized protein n=1 Tax=Leadbettera azotonutricia (strain ATCC BAA-888 / DSM 13862 / ZAS-9) TaxID=545695 RepID=F5YB82_LEAAZ|nr:hypothetical protein TREAZ_2985 [Leadbettera azotonutricia ZAS-9]